MSERAHCDRCGGPIRYDANEPSPGWLHVNVIDDMVCPLGDQFLLIKPAGPEVDLDALYARHHPERHE